MTLRVFDKAWKDVLILKRLQARVHSKMYMWIPYYLFGRITRVKLDGFTAERSGKSDFSNTVPVVYQRHHKQHHLVRLQRYACTQMTWHAVWTSSEHTSTTFYKLQEIFSSIATWTDKRSLTLNSTKANATLFSLSTANEQVKLKLRGEVLPQTDTSTIFGVKLDTCLTLEPRIEEMERGCINIFVS